MSDKRARCFEWSWPSSAVTGGIGFMRRGREAEHSGSAATASSIENERHIQHRVPAAGRRIAGLSGFGTAVRRAARG